MPRKPYNFLSMCIFSFFITSAFSIVKADIDPRWLNGSFKGFNLSSYKNSKLNSNNFAELRKYGVNLVRIIIDTHRNKDGKYEIGESDKDYLDRVLTYAQGNKISVVLTLQLQPAGNKADYWYNEAVQAQIGNIWSSLAKKYKGNEWIVAFDLLNEPVIPQPLKLLNSNIWADWAVEWIKKIRDVDPNRTIVFEPAPWALPAGFVSLTPLNYDNVVYSFHSYTPQLLTHQGINGYPKGMEYGETGNGKDWDKIKLRESVLPVIKFSDKYKLPVYVGEFSIINNAKLSTRIDYINDSIDIFTLNHYSWTYHSYKEWVGWDPEVEDNSGDKYSTKDRPRFKSVMDLLKVKFLEAN